MYLSQEILTMKANPGRIVKKVVPALPGDKTHAIKREPEFIRAMNDIEDYIGEISV